MIWQQGQDKTVENKRLMTARIRAIITTIFLALSAAFLLGTYGCKGPCCPSIEEFSAAGVVCEEQEFGLVDVEVDVAFTERDPDDSSVSLGSCRAEESVGWKFVYGNGELVEYSHDNTRWDDNHSRFYGTYFGVRVEKDNDTLVFCIENDVDCPVVCRCGNRLGDTDLDCPCDPEAPERMSIRGDCASTTIPVGPCSGIPVPPGIGVPPDENDHSHK